MKIKIQRMILPIYIQCANKKQSHKQSSKRKTVSGPQGNIVLCTVLSSIFLISSREFSSSTIWDCTQATSTTVSAAYVTGWVGISPKLTLPAQLCSMFRQESLGTFQRRSYGKKSSELNLLARLNCILPNLA